MKFRHAIITVLVGMIRLYKAAVSPVLPPSCRFTPTCSMYAVDALRKYGPVRGVYLSVMRLLRCNPFCKGGYDPVP